MAHQIQIEINPVWVKGKRPPIMIPPLIMLVIIIGTAVLITMFLTSTQTSVNQSPATQQTGSK